MVVLDVRGGVGFLFAVRGEWFTVIVAIIQNKYAAD